MDTIVDANGGDVRMIDSMSGRVRHSATTFKKAPRSVTLDEGYPKRLHWNAVEGLRDTICVQGGLANIPPKSNLVERFYIKLKFYRSMAMRYDKLRPAFLAMVKLACIKLRLRHYSVHGLVT